MEANMSQLTDMLGCKYPIIHGPIGMLNSPEMVAAVSEAGAYGMLALGFIQDTDQIKKMIDEVKSITEKPFGANIMLTNPNNMEILKVLADAGVKTITTSVGNPTAVYPVIHDLGMKGLHVVLALQHALRAVKSGVDGVVMAGAEAGGLRSMGSELSTMTLVPLAADNINLPIVAAGGIAESRGYKAALALGAQGVQLGTRLIASEECNANQYWKESIINCKDGGTDLFPVGNMTVRGIITPELKERIEKEGGSRNIKFNFGDLDSAWKKGDFSAAPPGAGEVSALINKIKSVKEIIEEMVS